MDRAVILPEGSEVSVTVNTNHEAVMSVDGHPPIVVVEGDKIECTASHYHLMMVRFKDPGYFYRNITLYMEHNPSAGNNE
jgi:NAD+ kinase